MKLLIILSLLPLLFLTSCQITLPVQGSYADGTETFTGTATGYMDGHGTITLTASNGLTVRGDFVYITGRQGEGTFTASDGRSGSFSFVSTGTRGTGVGYLGSDKVIFTFGKGVSNNQIEGQPR